LSCPVEHNSAHHVVGFVVYGGLVARVQVAGHIDSAARAAAFASERMFLRIG
jgi:hypothetical protein